MIAIMYASYIAKGMKSYSDVPKMFKEDVRQVLIDMELGHLAE